MNKVILIGNAGGAPEVRHTAKGDAIANMRLATSKSRTDKTTGDKIQDTEWHNLVFWGRTAEIAGEYVSKGSKIGIVGELRTRKWQDKDGAEKVTTEVFVQDLELLSPKPDQAQPARQAPRPPTQQALPTGGGIGDLDDDIPF